MRRRSPIIALLVLLALLAGACGGSDDTGDDGAGEGAADGSSDDASDSGGDFVDQGVDSESEPVPGGELVYAIGAETDGWNPTRNAWAPEGVQIGLTVYDPLAAFDIEGVAQPYLAESITPNDDYTEWTITLRPDVTFHNGDPLTAEAVKVTLEGHRDSALSAPTLTPLEEVEVVDDLTAVARMSTPWVVFPAILTGQIGVVPHPSIITDNVNDEPIGTGPFQFVEWIPDNRFVAEKNPDYWREGLPYLDRIEYRPISDDDSRESAFAAGDVDMFSGGSPDDIRTYEEQARDGDDVQFFADRGENEESFVMLNLEAAPFDDPRVRRALALATDAETYNEVMNAGLLRIARGPFVPGNPFFVETDYPAYDPEAAGALLEEIEADTGEPVSFTFVNTPDDFSRQQSAVLEEMWTAAGFDVELAFTEQTQYIVDALGGNYQANGWRQFGAPDPDADYQWWFSTSGLNFARVKDPEVDAALEAGRTTADPDERAAAYATLQERFTELLPYIWLVHVEWGLVAQPWVQDIPSGPLPDGQESKPFVTGTHRVTQTWIDESLR